MTSNIVIKAAAGVDITKDQTVFNRGVYTFVKRVYPYPITGYGLGFKILTELAGNVAIGEGFYASAFSNNGYSGISNTAYTNGNYANKYIYLDGSIDLTPFSKMIVQTRQVTQPYAYLYIDAAFLSSDKQTINFKVIHSEEKLNGNDIVEDTIDISNINGYRYIGFTGYCRYGNYKHKWCEVLKVVLRK